MPERYRPEEYEQQDAEREGRRPEGRGEERRWGDEGYGAEGPPGRYGQGQSGSSRYGLQGWQREQTPGRETRPNEWSRGLREGEWQRQQLWDLAGGPSAGWYPEEERGGGGRYRGSQGGSYGMEYPDTANRSPGGYGEMYRGDFSRYTGQSQEERYGRGGPYSGKGPRGYKRSDDRIREEVCERLTFHSEIDAEDIDVRVKDGEVTLQGSVMDRYQKRLAEDAVEGVSGVNDVHNQLRAGMGGETRQYEGARAGGQSSSSTDRMSQMSGDTGGRSERTSGSKPSSRSGGSRSQRGGEGGTTPSPDPFETSDPRKP